MTAVMSMVAPGVAAAAASPLRSSDTASIRSQRAIPRTASIDAAAAAAAAAAVAASKGVNITTSPSCPKCGFDNGSAVSLALAEAQQRIADLESQVRLLSQKATAAVDRWADYEDEIAKLRSEHKRQQQQQQMHSPTIRPSTANPGSKQPPSPIPTPTRSSFLSTTALSLSPSRLSALLSPRKPSGAARSPSPTPSADRETTSRPSSSIATARRLSAGGPPPTPPTRVALPIVSSPRPLKAAGAPDLLEALSREQALRRAAEGRLTDTSREVEELSVALFEQANEMVAGERRARARLEARVDELEKRDSDRGRRLDLLELSLRGIREARATLARGGQEREAKGSTA